MADSSDRFKTDKNFKDTIIKNCSRLKKKSEDNCIEKTNKIQYKINNIKRITNFKKLNNLRDSKFVESKDSISIDSQINPERKIKRFIISKRNTTFNLDYTLDLSKEKEKNKNENIINKQNNGSLYKINKINTINRYTVIGKYRNKTNEKLYDEKEGIIDINTSRDLIRNTNEIKSPKNGGIKELFINSNNSSDKNRSITKRSNSIRRIINSLYYQSDSIQTEREEKNNLANSNINDYKKNNNKILFYQHKKKFNIPNINFSKINNKEEKVKKLQKIEKNENKDMYIKSKGSFIYQKKYRKIGNIYNSNNFFFNTNSTEDNSTVTNDLNAEMIKKINDDNQNSSKLKIVYRKPQNITNKSNENEILSNSITINQAMHSRVNRGKLLFPKRTLEIKGSEAERSYSKDKRGTDNILTPIMRYNRDKKFLFSGKDISAKKNNFDSIRNSKSFDTSINLITEFFDDLIELCNCLEERTIFDIFIKNHNKKYIIEYNNYILEKNLNENQDSFNYCFKYYCIILIAFLFLSRDEIMYKYNSVKVHLLFIQYIYSTLCYIGYQDLKSKNVKRFFKDYHFKKKISIIQCTTSIIKLLFDDREEYNSLNNALKQLIVNARTKEVPDIVKIINETILFCFNQKSKNQKNNFPFGGLNSIAGNYLSNNKEENNKNIQKSPMVPYIKTSMNKKFCLVLDLDETISHSLKLNFGYYFLLRPGVKEFLTELSEFYEIIIFTSSPKIYADSIIDKIDQDGNLITHRLYKSHVIFERGKSVKKLNLIGRDLNKIIFVDNMKSNAKYNPKNLYLIPSWTDDIFDNEMYKLKRKLKYICTSGKFNDDVTKGL